MSGHGQSFAPRDLAFSRGQKFGVIGTGWNDQSTAYRLGLTSYVAATNSSSRPLPTTSSKALIGASGLSPGSAVTKIVIGPTFGLTGEGSALGGGDLTAGQIRDRRRERRGGDLCPAGQASDCPSAA